MTASENHATEIPSDTIPIGVVRPLTREIAELFKGGSVMVDYLTYCYRRGTEPFQSLSALSDVDAMRIMQALYIEGSLLWERFKDPHQYLQERRQIEQWLHKEFIAKGGEPQESYPIYMMLGSPRWANKMADAATLATSTEIQVPLSILEERDVSFTYPDSMASYWFGRDQPGEYYQPDYHGKVFTLSEILSIVAMKGLPEEGWTTNTPDDLPHYIEAQVWNRKPLLEYKRRLHGDMQGKMDEDIISTHHHMERRVT